MGMVSYSGLSVEVDPTVSAQITSLDLINGTQLNNAVSGLLSDAPSDGSQYARQNGSWAIVVGGGGGSTQIPQWDNYITYTVGQQVIYSNRLFYLSTFIGAAGYNPINSPQYWTEISESTNTGIGDAPSDNSQYVRQNGAWAIASYINSLPDAPNDDNQYIRRNNGWQNLGGYTIANQDWVGSQGYQTNSDVVNTISSYSFLTDAPSDGNQYTRQNGNWSVVSASSPSGKTVNTYATWGSISGSDANQIIFINGWGMPFGITIPDDATINWSNGTEITVVVDNISCGYTIQGGMGVAINGTGSYTITSYVTKLVKVTYNTWYIS